MSAPRYRYELWSLGQVVGHYKTLGQALLGALWRSRKSKAAVFIWQAGKTGHSIAYVRVEL